MRAFPVLVLLLALAGCAPSREALPSAASTARSALASLFAPARDYRLGTRRPGGDACPGSGSVARYVESLEYVGLPPVAFGLDGQGCIREMRVDYADGTGRFDHAVALVTQRLGAPAGEDRATCPASGEAVHCVYWIEPEGRFEVVRAGPGASPEFVLRPAEAPFTYARLCEGGVTRD